MNSALMSSLVVSLLFCNTLCSLKPLLYIDNGWDQTVIERQISKSEKREMQLEILKLLDLSDTPKKVKKTEERAAPKFLLDIYRTLVENENEEYPRRKRSSDLNLSGEEQNAIDESDIIMTFEPTGHQVGSVRHERGKMLWFDVTRIPNTDNVVRAELRIFQKEKESGKKIQNVYSVAISEVITTTLGDRNLKFISTVNTTGKFNGWLSLNLTHFLPRWMAFPESKKGLYLSVQSLKKTAHELTPEDIGLIITKAHEEKQPFMVMFLKSLNWAHKEIGIVATSPRRRNKRSDYTTIMQQKIFGTCRMHNLFISFKDLGWKDWILAPEGFSPYYCDGECNFPLNAYTNATNHAIIQSLVHIMEPTKYPKPRCTPTKLKMFPIVHYKGDTNVVVFKKFKDMIAHSCGCH